MPKPNTRDAMKRYRAGKAGFTDKAHLKENGFEFEVNENYGETFRPGTYRVKRNITDLEGDIVINIDEEVIFEGKTDTIMGYDVFKYKNVYLTTEDLYANA